MERENLAYYKDFKQIGNVPKPSVMKLMFTSQFVKNREYDETKLLTYAQFVSKFIYVKRKRYWKPRKRDYTIDRLIWIPATTRELYYTRMLLTVKKEPPNYDDIKIIESFKH